MTRSDPRVRGKVPHLALAAVITAVAALLPGRAGAGEFDVASLTEVPDSRERAWVHPLDPKRIIYLPGGLDPPFPRNFGTLQQEFALCALCGGPAQFGATTMTTPGGERPVLVMERLAGPYIHYSASPLHVRHDMRVLARLEVMGVINGDVQTLGGRVFDPEGWRGGVSRAAAAAAHDATYLPEWAQGLRRSPTDLAKQFEAIRAVVNGAGRPLPRLTARETKRTSVWENGKRVRVTPARLAAGYTPETLVARRAILEARAAGLTRGEQRIFVNFRLGRAPADALMDSVPMGRRLMQLIFRR